MSSFQCAQRGCKFDAATAPAECPVCKNPFVDVDDAPASNGGEAPWSDYTLAELLEYAKNWGVELSGRVTKAYVIERLEAVEAAAAAG